ncbi:MAG: NusG domain II-containing protein [Treponemataceae bacterium]
MKKKSLFTIGDVVIIMFIVTLCVVLTLKIYKLQGEKLELIVESNNNTWIYPLDENRTFSVDGVLGKTKIVIESSFVYFIESPCVTKTCIASQKINHPNQWIACLPNQIFVYIKGNKEQSDFDLIL